MISGYVKFLELFKTQKSFQGLCYYCYYYWFSKIVLPGFLLQGVLNLKEIELHFPF